MPFRAEWLTEEDRCRLRDEDLREFCALTNENAPNGGNTHTLIVRPKQKTGRAPIVGAATLSLNEKVGRVERLAVADAHRGDTIVAQTLLCELVWHATRELGAQKIVAQPPPEEPTDTFYQFEFVKQGDALVYQRP